MGIVFCILILVDWGAVNQVFHGISCVLGSSQSAVGQSNFFEGVLGNLSGCHGISNLISLE